MIVLIPAYEPDNRLLDLISLLGRCPQNPAIVVVDDGSGPDFANTFQVARFMGCTVLTHKTNLGKGVALKTGFAHIEQTFPGHAVVCADSDGQHSVEDILNVGSQVIDEEAMVLGSRQFTGKVPLKSRFGNTVTTLLFRIATGRAVRDTQTGLRAYPPSMLHELQNVPGEHFEYELNLLLRATKEQTPIREVVIQTIYLEGNTSTHFRPLVDSARVYKPLLAFMLSSLMGFAIDVVALLVLHAVTGNLLASVIGARVLSATCNFAVNRNVVFSASSTKLRSAVTRYAALAIALLAANYLLLSALTSVVPLFVGKVVTELLMVLVSYQVQRRSVFTSGRQQSTHEHSVRRAHRKTATDRAA